MTATMRSARPPSTLWHALLSTLRSQNGQNASTPALVSPQGSINWSYEDLQAKVRGLSRGLQERGVQKGSVVVTDLPNVAEGLVLHLACARLGAAVATAKNAEMLKSTTFFPNITCAVVTPESSWLSQEAFRAPHIVAGQDEMESMLSITTTSEDDVLDYDTEEHAIDRPLGYFASSNALTQGDALQQGRTMRDYFGMNEDDRVCVSITLYHAFGIGSACAGAIQAGSAIVLPAVGGLQGCGVPSQRAEVTLKMLAKEECTLLFADTHTLRALHNESLSKALQQANLVAHLRGGVCKTGSGTEILTETVDLAGVTLATLGKKK